MQCFEASAASEVLLFLPDCSGHVLSVYDNYVNILLGDRVLALSRDMSVSLPFGVTVAATESWHRFGLGANHPVRLRGGRLELVGAFEVRGLATCRRFSCRPRRDAVYRPHLLGSRLVELEMICRESPRSEGIIAYLGPQNGGAAASEAPNGVVERRMRLRFQSLVTGIRQNDDCLIAEGAHGLLGVGPGLTPSGDDFLLGFLAGLTSWPEEHCRTAAAKLGTCLVRDAPAQTTRIAAEYLRYAAMGCYHSYLTSLINAFLAGTDGELADAAAEMLTMGHFSGTDLLLGFVYGGQTACQARERGCSA